MAQSPWSVGQSLTDYCTYYNDGTHGHGYDLDGRVDVDKGRRIGKQRKGISIRGTNKVVHPGERSYFKPIQVIRIVKRRLAEIPSSSTREMWREAKHISDQLTAKGEFNPLDQSDARKKLLANIVRRHGQEKFRAELFRAFDGRCAVTGCVASVVLEAAHIRPYNGPQTNCVSNGILLRADIHTLYDLNLIAIDPHTIRVSLASTLRGSEYERYHGRAIRLSADPSSQPNIEALRNRWQLFQRRSRE